MPPELSTGILTSFWYYRRFDFDRFAPVPLILDSGAFSAYTSGGEVQLEEYAEWATALAGRWQFAFNLDVLGDAKASLANWERMRVLGVETVPVIHYGDRPENVLPAYLAQGADRIALGGIAVSGAGTQVTSWRFARLGLWTGKRWVTVPLDGHSIYRYSGSVRRYGINPAEVTRSSPATRLRLVELATRSEAAAAEAWNATQVPSSRFLANTDLASHAQLTRYLTTKPSVVTGAGLDRVSHVLQEEGVRL